MISRLAPSPTGALHLGHARSFLAAWLHARKAGGRIFLRMEDLDTPRCQPWAIGQMLEDLTWLGLDWDTPPNAWPGAMPEGYVLQSKRTRLYDEALARLASERRLFPCTKSRRDLQGLSSAPHGMEGLPPYPKEFRPEGLSRDWFLEDHGRSAFRFQVEDGLVCFEDGLDGWVCQDVAAEVGDFVLRRQDGFYAYQLAVVADDLAMGVTDVVRGADLLTSAPRQLQLIKALGGRVPKYYHVGLVVGPDGEKLSKRHGGLELRSLRARGVSPERLLAWLGHSLGLQEESKLEAQLEELVSAFRWHEKAGTPVVLGPGLWE
jgi:glutamyl-tRNA synthetase